MCHPGGSWTHSLMHVVSWFSPWAIADQSSKGEKIGMLFKLLDVFTWNLDRILSLLIILKSSRRSFILPSMILILHFTVKPRAFSKKKVQCPEWPQTWKTWKTWKTQGIRKIVRISGKTREIWSKTWKLRENVRYVTWSQIKMYCSKFLCLELLRENSRNLGLSKMWPLWCLLLPSWNKGLDLPSTLIEWALFLFHIISFHTCQLFHNLKCTHEIFKAICLSAGSLHNGICLWWSFSLGDAQAATIRAAWLDFCLPQTEFRTWLTEIQESDWSVAMVLNSIDHAVEGHVLKTIDNVLKTIDNVLKTIDIDLNRGLLTHLQRY